AVALVSGDQVPGERCGAADPVPGAAVEDAVEVRNGAKAKRVRADAVAHDHAFRRTVKEEPDPVTGDQVTGAGSGSADSVPFAGHENAVIGNLIQHPQSGRIGADEVSLNE